MKKIYIVFLLIVLHILNFSQSYTLKEKIGQMVMIGFYGDTLPDSLSDDFDYYNLGGVILFRWQNNLNDPFQIQNLTDQINANRRIPLFIAIDQEGGKVARLNQYNGFEESYTAHKLGTIINLESTTRFWAGKMAGWLYDCGINTNLAPVADVNVDSLSPAIGALERSYSRFTAGVYSHASWFIDEFHKKNIITTLKHFPGHGSAAEDSHLGFTDVTTTWADSELVPFANIINDNNADMIMTAHIFNANIDTNYPATLSYNTIQKLLRDTLGYNGVVISDAMLMGALVNQYGLDTAIVLAVNAGVDILVYTIYQKDTIPNMLSFVVNTIYQKVQDGFIPEERINESFERIMNLKQKYSLVSIVRNEDVIPNNYQLTNYPNPFNSSTTIVFEIPVATNVKIKIFNILGEEIKTVIDDFKSIGKYSVQMDFNELPSGVYILTMFAENNIISRKVTLLK